MNSPNEDSSEDGVSGKLKAAVISLTVLTTIAGIIFFVLVFKKVSSSSKTNNRWERQLLVIAERLHKEGLIPQAIRHYEMFLGSTKPDLKKRAQVSFTLGKLYQSQNNCPEALSWFYQVELADPQFLQLAETNEQIALCKTNIDNEKS